MDSYTEDDHTRKRSYEELERENQTLKAALKEKDETIYQSSMKRLITERPNMEVELVGSISSHTRTKYDPATARMGPFKMAALDEKSFTKSVLQRPSALIKTFRSGSTIGSTVPPLKTVTTEADVSKLVSCALEDAVDLAVAATEMKFVVRYEASMFAHRPDNLVVCMSGGEIPLLIVEVKKPYGADLTTEQRVVGQTFDYLVAMRAFGHSSPFAIVTTFEKSVMLWHDDIVSNNVAADNDQIRSTITVTKSDSDGDTRSSSTTGEHSSTPAEVKEGPGEQQNYANTFTKHDVRQLWQSPEYGSQDIVPLFLTAILCGLVRNPSAKVKRPIVRPTTGYIGNALKLVPSSQTNYTWGELNAKRGKLIQDSSMPWFQRLSMCRTTAAYYAIQDIGVGSTSRAFLALDDHAKECVIKMFVNRHDDGNIFLLPNAFKKRAMKSTSLEADALKKTYAALQGKVYTSVINGLYCVIMPFFTPIEPEHRRTAEVQDKIKKAFQLLHKTGKTYEDCDVRWSHVGKYENNVVLFDLADLIELQVDEETATNACITLLNSRDAGPS